MVFPTNSSHYCFHFWRQHLVLDCTLCSACQINITNTSIAHSWHGPGTSSAGEWRDCGWSQCMLHLLQACILVAKGTGGRGHVLPLSFLLSLFSARLPLSLDVSVLNNIPRILMFTPTPFPSPSMLLLSQPFQSSLSLSRWTPHPFYHSPTTPFFVAPCNKNAFCLTYGSIQTNIYKLQWGQNNWKK